MRLPTHAFSSLHGVFMMLATHHHRLLAHRLVAVRLPCQHPSLPCRGGCWKDEELYPLPSPKTDLELIFLILAYVNNSQPHPFIRLPNNTSANFAFSCSPGELLPVSPTPNIIPLTRYKYLCTLAFCRVSNFSPTSNSNSQFQFQKTRPKHL